MIFEKKKIKIETLGEYLTEVRLGLNLQFEDVIKKTGLKPQFLKGLENGNIKDLPADVYVFGFLRQLSALYLVDSESLIQQYKKEKSIQQQLEKEVVLNSIWYKRYFKKLVITPKFLSLTLGTGFVLITIFYIILQVWSINKSPSLEIFQPGDNSAIAGSSVQIVGKTDPGMLLSINSQDIFVDSQGNFKTQLGLSPGPKEINITATNRFGKVVNKTIHITGEAPAAIGQQAEPLKIRIDFTAPVVLGFAIDDQPTQTLSFSAGDSKTFSANSKIVVSTSDAGATKVTINGQLLGPMGRNKESLSNIPFYAQSNSIPLAK